MADVLSRNTNTATLQFSPGDVDEAIIALIDLGTPKNVHEESTDGGLFRSTDVFSATPGPRFTTVTV